MDTAAWIVQVLLAIAFAVTGFGKLTQPYEKLNQMMPYTKDFSPNIVKLIGLVELLAAIGLILPSLLKILPILTPIAALGLVLTMIGAIITHVRRNEYPVIVANLVLLALAAFVAYARFAVVPIV